MEKNGLELIDFTNLKLNFHPNSIPIVGGFQDRPYRCLAI